MVDAVTIIKNKLTMQDVLLKYGFNPKRRMKCPLHNGDGLNFEIKDTGYICYSRCGSGDVISFVQKLFGLSFPETLKKIDNDFGLFIYEKPTLKQYRKMQQIEKKIKERQHKYEADLKNAKIKYNRLCKILLKLQDDIHKYAPKTPEDDWNSQFVNAVKKSEYINYLLDYTEEQIEVIQSERGQHINYDYARTAEK